MNETQLIESYLLNKAEPADKLLMDARLLIDSRLKEKILWQQTAYSLVKAYGHKSLKQEIEAVHNKLFSEKRFEGFRKKISRIFNSH